MKKAVTNITPFTEEILKALGDRIRIARLRRNLPVQTLANNAGISRATLWKIESGNPAVAIGSYAAVLHMLDGMDEDLFFIAADTETDLSLPAPGQSVRKRARTKKDPQPHT